MREHGAPERLRTDAVDDVFVGEAVKPVPEHPLVEEVRWKGEALRSLGHRPVERRIEARDLR